MQQEHFKGLVIDQHEGQVQAAIQELSKESLPPGDVVVAVAYSDLNYKDGLAVTGKARVIRSYPMVPGIDFAGTVEESHSPDFKPGDQVILTGWEVGERYWGGYAQRARVRADWLVPVPEGLSLKQAMGIGTAGFTAMLCVMALEEHGLTPGEREVVVTGASGGVGSIAVAVLAKRSYNVVAATGRPEEQAYLQELGARAIIDRNVLSAPSNRPLESERWGGAVDAVGGETLAGLLRSMAPGTSVAACGNAGGVALHTTVLPFILRGVNVLGINSVFVPQPRRREAWERLVRDLPLDLLDRMIQVVPLEAVPDLSNEILKGHIRGRVVVDVNA